MSRPHDWWVLDLGDDPTPGDPGAVRLLSARMRRVADDAAAAERDARGLAGDGAVRQWIGAAGEVFRGALEDFPTQLAKVADSYAIAADALQDYGTRLDAAQAQADRALQHGRAAREQMAVLSAGLSTARASASSASRAVSSLDSGPHPPDPAQVRAALHDAQAAAARASSLADQLSGAQGQLAAATRMAQEARELREQAAGRAAAQLDDASDAGIQPSSWWDSFKSGAARLWEATIVVAKVAVAVLGIVVLVLGGPLAWVVVGLSLLVLVDALAKLSRGEGSWADVAVAALGLIPGTRGLTSAGALRGAWQGRGALGVAGELGRALQAVPVGAVTGARNVWEGRKLLPVLARQAPGAAGARITTMAVQLRHGTPGALRGFAAGFADGTGVVGRLRTGVTSTGEGFRDAHRTFLSSSPGGTVHAARAYQGSTPYLGVDRWSGTVLRAGTRLEAGFPGLSGFVVPGGSLDDVGRSSATFAEGAQVGSWKGTYRETGIGFAVTTDVPAATGTARANPQFGAGGQEQHFVPSFTERVLAGDIVAVAPDGQVLMAVLDEAGALTVLAGNGDLIALQDLTPRPGIWEPEQVRSVVTGIRQVVDVVRVPVGVGTRLDRLNRLSE